MRRLLLPFVLFAAGCAPEIGDACDTSTDCSQNGDRLCDVSQQNGYCTIFDCEKGTCPEEATCVVFGASPSQVPECKNDTGTSPAQRSFCMLKCTEPSDCRDERDGNGQLIYGCHHPSVAGGVSIDDGARRVCMIDAKTSSELPASGDVCKAEDPSDGAAGAGGAGGD
jgi:hypothetical protein